MPFAAPQAGAVASAGGPCSRRTQQGGLQQSYRCPTVAAASRRRPSQLVRMMRQQPAARAASGGAGPGADAEAFGSADYIEAGEAAPAAAPAAPAPAAAAAPSGIGGPAAAASQPARAVPRPPPSMRSEDVALGIIASEFSISSEEEEEEEEEEAEGAEQSEVDSLKQEVSELRQLLIAQARLVQAQQRMIQQMEAAVGKAVVQSTTAVTAAEAAAEAAEAVHREGGVAFSRDGAPQASSSMDGTGLLDGPPSSGYVQDSALAGSVGTAGGAAGAVAPMIGRVKAEAARHDAAVAGAALHDRRLVGLYDARYHSTAWGATPRDYRILPSRIFLVRHAESEGNVDNIAYTYLPDPRVPLTARGWQQAMSAGDRLRSYMDAAHGGKQYKLFFYTSPYLRSRQTYEGLAQAFDPEQVQGVQEEVQLREQDFGNFQDAEGKKREKAERLRFGRFFYRFPNGESGADVYDRMTIFEDHLVRDINAGRFADNTSLVLVTHGLALRIFLMRWFHWTVDQFMDVFNPPNAEPLVLERVPTDTEARQGGPAAWIHTKALYRLSDSSREIIKGCTPDMCQTSWVARGINPLDPADSLLLPAGSSSRLAAAAGVAAGSSATASGAAASNGGEDCAAAAAAVAAAEAAVAAAAAPAVAADAEQA